MEPVFVVSLVAVAVSFIRPWLVKKLYEIEPDDFRPEADYNGTAVRVKPDFYSGNLINSLISGGFWGVLSFGFGRILVGQHQDGGENFFIWFYWLCSLFFIFPVILFMVRGSFSSVKRAVVNIRRRWVWFKEAEKVEALLVDRQVEEVVDLKGHKRLKYEMMLKVEGRLFRTAQRRGVFDARFASPD